MPSLPSKISNLSSTEILVVHNYLQAKKINKLTTLETTALANDLAQMANAYFGLKADKIQIQAILRMIKNNYGYLSQPDIVDAFEFASVGEKEISSFGQFTVSFVAKILFKFDKERRRIIEIYSRESQKSTKIEAPKSTPESSYNTLEKIIKEQGVIPLVFNWENVALHLGIMKNTIHPISEDVQSKVISHFKEKYPSVKTQAEEFSSKFGNYSRDKKTKDFWNKKKT